MTIPPDKLRHVQWGAGLALVVGATVLAARASPALAIALASAALAVGVELYQLTRDEGTASWADAAATAAPGWALALVVWLAAG